MRVIWFLSGDCLEIVWFFANGIVWRRPFSHTSVCESILLGRDKKDNYTLTKELRNELIPESLQ